MDLKPYFGTIVTVITVLVTFAVAWGTINTKVEANTTKLKNVVYQDEFKAILQGQSDMNANMNKRMDRIENKLDRIIERN